MHAALMVGLLHLAALRVAPSPKATASGVAILHVTHVAVHSIHNIHTIHAQQ